MKRSATFHDGDDESEDEYNEEGLVGGAGGRGGGRKSMQRSSTMPIDESPAQGTLSAIGSSFKLPFA